MLWSRFSNGSYGGNDRFALSPDGRQLLVAGSATRLVDAQTGHLLRTLPIGSQNSEWFELKGQSRALVQRSEFGGTYKVHLYDAESWQLLGSAPIEWEFGVSKQGRFVYDLKSVRRLPGLDRVKLFPPPASILCVTDDESRVLTTQGLYDLATGVLTTPLTLPSGTTRFANNGRFAILSAGIRIYSPTGVLIQQLSSPTNLTGFAWCPTNDQIVASEGTGLNFGPTVSRWVGTGNAYALDYRFSGFTEPAIYNLSIRHRAEEGKVLTRGYEFFSWDFGSRTAVRLDSACGVQLRTMEAGRRLVSYVTESGLGDRIRAWSADTGEQVADIPLNHYANDVDVIPGTSKVVIAHDQQLSVWNLDTGLREGQLLLPISPRHVAASRNGYVAVASYNTIQIYELNTGKLMSSRIGTGPVSFSPDGTRLLVGIADAGSEYGPGILAVPQGQIQRLYSEYSTGRGGAWAPNGAVAFSAQRRDTSAHEIVLDDPTRGIRRFPGWAYSLSFTPDSAHLFLSRDTTIEVRRTSDWSLRAFFDDEVGVSQLYGTRAVRAGYSPDAFAYTRSDGSLISAVMPVRVVRPSPPPVKG